MTPRPEQIFRGAPALLVALSLCAGSAASAAQKAQEPERTAQARTTHSQAARIRGGKTDAAQGNASEANTAAGARGRNGGKSAKLDRTGHKRVGKASFYSRKFAGRKMADGTRMDPRDDNAASKTLPLGTTARVTNLATDKSAAVTIQDRGPYVPGRIIDLSPSSAAQIGITRKEGVAPVEVAPIAVPQADGRVKPGAGATERVGRNGQRSR